MSSKPNNVMFMQNCFCPDENQFSRLERSLLSLAEYGSKCKTNNHYHFYLSGYIAPEFKDRLDKAWNQLVSKTFTHGSSKFFKGITLMLNPNNLGKGKVCNYIIEKFSKNDIMETDYEYIFMFDNDIVFKPCSEDIVDILITQQKEMDDIGGIKYPVISCNFEEHQVHQIGALDQGFKTKDGRMVKCSTAHFGCLGGGCWLVEREHWKDIGGYCSDTIYGKDDGMFYLDTIRAGKMVCLSEDIWVIHPNDDDQTYNLFKADTNVNRVLKMDYKELGIDNDNFWNSR